jgi:hypothetical protein
MAIIMAENIVHRITARRDEGHRRENAVAAAIEVGRPIGFPTLKRYSPLAAAVVSAIAAALVLPSPASSLAHCLDYLWIHLQIQATFLSG